MLLPLSLKFWRAAIILRLVKLLIQMSQNLRDLVNQMHQKQGYELGLKKNFQKHTLKMLILMGGPPTLGRLMSCRRSLVGISMATTWYSSVWKRATVLAQQIFYNFNRYFNFCRFCLIMTVFRVNLQYK